MPDTPVIPADLVALQRAYDHAHAAVTAHVDSIDVPGQPVAAWTPEQHNTHRELRDVRLAAVVALHRHPVMVAARAEGRSREVEDARRKAARGE